jgi:hypothetical protein
MMNNAQVRACADGLARRCTAEKGKALDEAVKSAYTIALGRQPTATEQGESVQFIKEQLESYKAVGKANGEQLALTDFCQVLLELNEFLYVD